MKYKLTPDQNGISPHRVVIEPYNTSWPVIAAEKASELQRILAQNLLKVEHIGSTSIPGMAAKPIIDLIPIVASLTELDEQKQVVGAAGYAWCGEFGIPGRRFCALTNAAGERLVHLHFFQVHDPTIDRHLIFRDYLLTHPQRAKAYEDEKKRAARLHPDDSFAYNDEKANWLQALEKEALRWKAANSHFKNT